MNIVSCYAAAKIAKVSKQIMSTRKIVNASNKSKYKYFSFDPKTGEFGVDLDNIDWKRYMTKRQSTPSFKKQQSEDTKSQSIYHEQDNLVDKNNFAQAVVLAVKEQLGLNSKELKKLLGLIEIKYEGME